MSRMPWTKRERHTDGIPAFSTITRRVPARIADKIIFMTLRRFGRPPFVESHGLAVSVQADQSTSCPRARRILPCSEDQVCADRIGQRLHPAGRCRCGSIVMHPHVAEIVAEACRKKITYGRRIQWTTGRRQDMLDRRQGSRPIVASARLPSSGQLPEAPPVRQAVRPRRLRALHSRFVSTNNPSGQW